MRDKAREAAERAIRLDPDLAEAHFTLAAVLTYFDWDWEGAEREYRRANEIDPNLAMNHYHYAWYLALFDGLDEAIEEHKRAQELDPLTPLHTAWLGELYNMAGRYDDGIAEARKTLDMDDRNAIGLYVTGMGYLGRGMIEEAIEAHEAAGRQPELEVRPRGDVCRGGPESRRRADPPRGRGGGGQLLRVLGNLDEAFRWWDYEPHHAWVAGIRVWPPDLLPEANRLRQDPCFQDLMGRMRLPPPGTDRG
ncbi:MAG: tetratricopeptide repeat protein [Gemmatimonadota bacterium]